jgi:histidinol-phosphate/aromatic aminotransferase/cobyric acid decarboxylase-like protein
LLPHCLQVAACAALTNLPYINSVRDALLSERSRLFDELASISWLQPYPSQANFILCKVTEVRPVQTDGHGASRTSADVAAAALAAALEWGASDQAV